MAEIEILEVEGRIRKRVKTQMEKTQKDYYLNEQMRAIQKEMGEEDTFKGEMKELEKKLKEKKLPEEAHQKVEQEMKKLKMMSPMSAEATVVRNYIDWIFALPWDEKTEDKKDLNESEMILEEDHYGLKKGERKNTGIPRCPDPVQKEKRFHPLFCRPSRGGKNLRCEIDCQGYQQKICQVVSWRSER